MASWVGTSLRSSTLALSTRLGADRFPCVWRVDIDEIGASDGSYQSLHEIATGMNLLYIPFSANLHRVNELLSRGQAEYEEILPPGLSMIRRNRVFRYRIIFRV